MNLKKAVLLCGCLLLVRAGSGSPSLPFLAEADDASDPYKIIAERNVFHLNPMPIPPPPVPPKVELPTIKFSGWFRVGRVTKALFCTLPKDKKETPSYYDLCEGEKAGFLELVKIRYDQGEVDVINSGVAMTLSLKEATGNSLSGKMKFLVKVRFAKAEAKSPWQEYGLPFHRL
jgi:hypothetical protein